MTSDEIWQYIHGERRALAGTLSELSTAQWATPSLCEGWTVQQTTGHVVAAAEQTTLNFYKELAQAGFKLPRLHRPGGTPHGRAGPDDLVRRLEARTPRPTIPRRR